MSDQTPGVPPTPLPPTHQSTYEPSSYESPGYQAASYPTPTHETLTTLSPVSQPRRSSGLGSMVALLLAVVVVLASAGAGVYFLSEWAGGLQGPDGRGTATTSGAGGVGAEPESQPMAPLISVVGFKQFVDALREETGSTSVVDLTVYPQYAVAVVPLPGGKGRTQSLYYDGDIRETNLGTSTDKPFDLRKVDAPLRVALSRKARKAIDEPTQWYLILRAPDVEGAVIYAYASNKYSEGGYISARLDGKIVRRVTW